MVTGFKDILRISSGYKQKGKKVGLATGCFDILHIGHIKFFREVKKHTDILIIGLENDSTIKLSKGNQRPINSLLDREEQLNELRSIDYIFPIEDVYSFGSEKANHVHEEIWRKLLPDFVFTAGSKDKYSNIKKKRAEQFNITFLEIESEDNKSSSDILGQILNTK